MKIGIAADEIYPVFRISDYEKKNFSITDAEYAEYLDVQAKWEAWQDKLSAMKPDGYVEPPPPSEAELEFQRFLASSTSILALQTPDSEAA